MLASFAFALALSLQAQPGVEDLAPAFGNTLVSTYPDGRTARMWLQADGRYAGQGRRGRASSGRWSVREGRVCFASADRFRRRRRSAPRSCGAGSGRAGRLAP